MSDFSARRVIMVDTQVRPSDVTKFPIIDAMLATPREAYVPVEKREAAYIGENLAIAPGRSLLDPRTLAKMLDALDITPQDAVLDIGSGLGYSAAVIAHMAEIVIAVESDPAMAAEAERALSAQSVDNVIVMTGELAKGAAKHGPYDVIILQGGVVQVPVELQNQLRDGGRIGALFINGALGTVRIGHKRSGIIYWRDAFNAAAPVLPGFTVDRVFKL